MLEDIIKIQPQTSQNYYTDSLEFAIPVKKPKEKASHYFKWGLVFHAKGKPAEAYKWYEQAIFLHKSPFYLKQMGILHHEMGYLKDAFKYIRIAVEIEKEIQQEKEAEEKRENENAEMYLTDITTPLSSDENGGFVYHYTKSH